MSAIERDLSHAETAKLVHAPQSADGKRFVHRHRNFDPDRNECVLGRMGASTRVKRKNTGS